MGGSRPPRPRSRALRRRSRVRVARGVRRAAPRDDPLPDFPVISATCAAATPRSSPRPTSPRVRRLPGRHVPTGRQVEVRRFFGDSIKGNAEMSFISIGSGDGTRPPARDDADPAAGRRHLQPRRRGRAARHGARPRLARPHRTRSAGGCRSSRTWCCGISACRSSSGRSPSAPGRRSSTVVANGVPILLGGTAVMLTLVLIVLVGGYLLRIPFDDLVGVCAGSTGNPAILAAAGRLAPTDRPDVGYAICFRRRRSPRSSRFRFC